ncbi:SDR family NAD(P)-dependent oxidoreductase [Rhabdothermincola sp.]|mgnify:CR=1 FL=1|uniref:SDR family NAD(P)-dependent oxidoreductase n=1 Tax=Rhabdothermincola sp. TaxID=2820405 RepID=UPI002FE200C2
MDQLSRRLEGKVAVVTGGGSGIGLASARALAVEGARVVVSDIDEERGRAAVDTLAAEGREAAFVRTDVADSSQCEQLVDATVERFGRLDIFHNNAGVAWPFRDGFTPDVSPQVWDRVIAVNLSGVFYCCHFAIPVMARTGGGSIINTASSMAHLPLGGLDGYAASKGGVAQLTRSLAPGCGRLGIRVNAISPGYVDTPMNEMIWATPALKAGFERGHATGLQAPEEVADVVVFLASDASRSLTGAVITCDRGWTAFKQPEILGGG